MATAERHNPGAPQDPEGAPQDPSGSPQDPGAALAGLRQAREQTLALVAPLDERQLSAPYSPLLSPLAWDLAHIAAFEDLWLAHHHGGLELLRPDIAELYDAFETPRSVRTERPILPPGEALEYMRSVRERVIGLVESIGVGDGRLHELVIRHEHQHAETMLQALELARLEGYGDRLRAGGDRLRAEPPAGSTPARGPASVAPISGLELIDVPAGAVEIGAGSEAFAYDNERPAHTLDVEAFRIGRAPVTNGDWLEFVQSGGYDRREWWSEAGWSYRHREGIRMPAGWSTAAGETAPWEWRLGAYEPLRPDRPVVHISWFEAEAFARAHACRLPSEAEWEKAARWDPGSGLSLCLPAERSGRANLIESRLYGTAPIASFPDATSPLGARDMLGDVWEWTASDFHGYPGFVAEPYREYSEVFFGAGYKVLRGGSWASSRRVATTTFRNWDFPIRRQIFAGVRLASDASGS